VGPHVSVRFPLKAGFPLEFPAREGSPSFAYNHRMPRLLVSTLLAAVLLGCATGPKPPPPPVPMTTPPPGGPREFSAKGEVIWKDLAGMGNARRAIFDDWRVKGPTVSLARSPEGRWVGKARGIDVVLAVEPGKIYGGDIAISLTFDDDKNIVVEGFWGAKPVKLILSKNKISGAIPTGPVDLTDMGAGMFNSYTAYLQIKGPSDMPQVVLAMLDVMID